MSSTSKIACDTCAAAAVCQVEVRVSGCSDHLPSPAAKKIVELKATEAIKEIKKLENSRTLGCIRDAEQRRKRLRTTVLKAIKGQLEEWQEVAW